VKALAATREHRAPFGAGFIANCDNKVEMLIGCDDFSHAARCFARDVDAFFTQCVHDNGVQDARFQARATGFVAVAAELVDERFRHLRARAVVDANEQDFLFHGGFSNRNRDNSQTAK